MLGFSPLASAPLGDDGVVTSDVFQLQSIVTGNPVVGSSSITQGTNFTLTVITSGQPLVPTIDLSLVHNLSPANVTSGQPLVPAVPLSLVHNLSPTVITSGQPLVPTITLVEDEVSTADPILTGVPEVSTASIQQNNSLVVSNILTGRPDVESAKDPNVIYEEVVQQMFGGWPKRIYDHTDLAISRGHSIGYRTLYKFGYNPDVDTQEETVWGNAGNYIWLDSAVNMFVSSTSVNDSGTGTGARTILIQGLDENYNEIEETITLNGQTQVTTQLSYLRIYRSFVTLAGSNEGTSGIIYIGSSGSTGGVPNSSVYASISIGNQTQIAAYTVPAGYTLYVDEINFTAAVSQSNKLVHCKFNSRDYESNVFRTRFVQVIQSNQLIQSFKYPQGFAEKTDLECRVSTDTSNTAIGASFQGVLIKNET
tara:strand:- start:324 stop:1592 length:1269 start_codon:yes stop_codon:yes gene_type:complete